MLGKGSYKGFLLVLAIYRLPPVQGEKLLLCCAAFLGNWEASSVLCCVRAVLQHKQGQASAITAICQLTDRLQ